MTTVGELFHIHKGHQLALNRIEQVGNSRDAVAYVCRSHRNNGVAAWVAPLPGMQPAQAGDLSVCLRSRNHSLATFVQITPFYTTYHVAVLKPRITMTLNEKLWWALCIRANRFRFNFGRQANRTLESLELPDEIPAWVSEHPLPNHDRGEGRGAEAIQPDNWSPFLISDLFSVRSGTYGSRRGLPAGETPLVSASDWNNGITDFVGVPPTWSGGQISLATNGSIGAAFYQLGHSAPPGMLLFWSRGFR